MPRPVNASRPPPARARQPRWAVLGALAAAVLPAVLAAGCGYSLDSPRLPDNAGTLAISAIRNQTTTGELDIRLQHLVRARMLRHASLDLVPIERSDMSVEILLADLAITRARSLTSTTVSSITYALRGDVSLLDRRSATYHFYKQPVTSQYSLNFDTPVVETPAIRDEGLTGVLDAFAQRVETLVLLSF